MDKVVQWLLEGDPWVRYRTYIDLLGRSDHEPDIAAAREEMLAHPKVAALVGDLAAWPGQVLTSHKSAGHPIHRLTFLANIGLRAGDPGMDAVIERIMEHQSPKGPFQVLMNIAKHYGGTGEDQWTWALCDAPLLVYALALVGLAEDPKVKESAAYLAGLVRDNGWPCAGALFNA